VFWADLTSEASFFQTAHGIVQQIVAHHMRHGTPCGEIASFLRLADLIDANGQITAGETEGRRVAGAIKRWLMMEGNGRWMLVLDNYDDTNAVKIHDLLPTCDTGYVIITSRRSDLQPFGKTIEIDEIDEQSGISLFLQCANKEGAREGGK
jgi:hypothetical protein